MPRYQDDSTAGSSAIFTDTAGWLHVPGQLPMKNVKELLPDGVTVRYTTVVLDGTTQRVVAYSEFPA